MALRAGLGGKTDFADCVASNFDQPSSTNYTALLI